MRRVIVPLDGTPETASAIPDARRLVGPGGELVFVFDTESSSPDDKQTSASTDGEAAEDIHASIRALATRLQEEGVTVRVLETTKKLTNGFESIVSEIGADLIACTRPELDRHRTLLWGGTLRRALAESPVPVLLCSPGGKHALEETAPPRPLVPLDGSKSAEAILPLAEDLAMEWGTFLWLTQVLPSEATARELATSWEYLRTVAADLRCRVRINVVTGRSVPTMLIRTVKDWMITDVLMASQGLTASPEVAVGSVAERLIERLQCRIVVLPLSATLPLRQARSAAGVALA